MSEIAVDFLRGRGWFSSLIAWGTVGEYSHAASVLQDGRYLDAHDDVIAGVPKGVQIRRPETEKWLKKRRATLQVSKADYDDWEANLRAKITDRYDEDAILGFLEGESMHTAGRWICSALAVNAIQHIGRPWAAPHAGFVPYPLVLPAHQVSPNALLLILQTAGFTIGPEVTA